MQLRWLAVATLLLLPFANAVPVLPQSFRKGFVVSQFLSDALGRNTTLEGVKQMALAGATHVEVEPLVTQPYLNSSTPTRTGVRPEQVTVNILSHVHIVRCSSAMLTGNRACCALFQ